MISSNVFYKLISYLESNFGKLFLFSEEKIDLNIRKQVVDIMSNTDSLNLTIKPFLYVKRKQLIFNILSCNKENEYDLEKETNKINDLINSQVKFFHLDPEFIINFVNQYEKEYRFQFSSGINVFNIVYESSIKNRIINNSENIDATLIINILRELAYYMHFSKKNAVGIDEIAAIIEEYEKTYRQKVKTHLFIDAALKSKILLENSNNFRFQDRTVIAYFVAQALNQKYYQEEDIHNNLNELLKNLCFNINSDIVLFLALITNNTKFINYIIDAAKKHYANQEELSFDKDNIKFLMDTSVPVKNTLPNNKERKEREENLEKQEEEIKLADLIELVNEYDYSEEDLKKVENQVIISFKYLEILSKALPAFCQNMKVDQQDVLVAMLYKCPNQFLYKVLGELGDNFEDVCQGLYEDISILRREKNIAEVSIQNVENMIKQISAVLIIALYQLVATTCTTEQSIAALNDFNYSNNSNYKLQNLMMISRINEVSSFSKRAQELNKEMNEKLEKSMIKYIVREYLLRNNVEIYGEAESLINCFFDSKTCQKLKMDIAKKRIIDKDRT